MSAVWGIISTPEDINYVGGYHDYTGVHHDNCGESD